MCCSAVVCAAAIALGFTGTALAERLLAQYDPVQSPTCEICKNVEVLLSAVRMLRHVYYEKPDPKKMGQIERES